MGDAHTKKQLVIATGNPGKRREFEVLLDELLSDDVEVFDRKTWPGALDEVVEDRDTFEGNAFKKALETSQQTGLCALADDSGLAVDALGGRPGVYSARYAGPDADDAANNRKLIEALQGVAAEDRSARYVAVLCLVLVDDAFAHELLQRRGETFESVAPAATLGAEGELVRIEDRLVVWVRATCEGRIVDTPRGSGGFGYDPHFLVEAWDQTMAQVSLDRKNEISHRARATRKLASLFA